MHAFIQTLFFIHISCAQKPKKKAGRPPGSKNKIKDTDRDHTK